MSESTVLVLGSDPPPKLDRLTGRAQVVFADDDSLADRLPTADVLLAWDFTSDAIRGSMARRRAPGPAGCTPRAPAWTGCCARSWSRTTTLVTNARGVFEQPIAEYVAGLVIAMAKDFYGSWELQRQRRWQHRETMRVAGTRAVVVGSGPIGRAIGNTLLALGVKVDLVGRRERSPRSGVRPGPRE